MTVYSVKTGNESIGLLAGNTAGISDFESIATVALTTTSANITFTSIPQNYSHLQLRIFGRSNRSTQESSYIDIAFNSDSGTNYSWHSLSGDGSAGGVSYATSRSKGVIQRITAANASANLYGASVIDILDYSNTNKYKTIKNLGGNDRNGAGQIFFDSNLWMSTSAITTITLTSEASASFIQYSHFALYGVRTV